MDIQNTFYIVGIVFMTLGILILMGIAIVLFYIHKKVGNIHNFIETRINELTALVVKPVKTAADMARSILPETSKKVKRKR